MERHFSFCLISISCSSLALFLLKSCGRELDHFFIRLGGYRTRPSCNRPWPSPRHQTTVSSNSKEEMVHHGPQQLLDVTCWWLLLSIACFIIPYSYLVCSTQVSGGALCNGLYMKNSREKKANKVKLRNYYTSQHFDSFIVIYYNFISTFRLANL